MSEDASLEDTVDVSMPSPREIRVTRVFDAPRDLVFDAYTKPELVRRWLWGPDDWPLAVCEVDLRVGGKFRYVWRHASRGDMGMGGVYKEILPPERTVHTELFDEDWTGGEVVVTTTFAEADGKTTVTITQLFSSSQVRDEVLKTGMIGGWAQCLMRLEDLLRHEAGAA